MIPLLSRRGFLWASLSAVVAIPMRRTHAKGTEGEHTQILKEAITELLSTDVFFLPPLPAPASSAGEAFRVSRQSLLFKAGIEQSTACINEPELSRIVGNLREAIVEDYRNGLFGWQEGWSVSNTESEVISFIAHSRYACECCRTSKFHL